MCPYGIANISDATLNTYSYHHERINVLTRNIFTGKTLAHLYVNLIAEIAE